MKRTLLALAAIALVMAGCAKKDAKVGANGKAYKIGITKIVAHPALDACEKGVQDELAARGISATFDLQNANGDVNTATQIASKFKADGVDAVVAIATPTAVAAANSIKDKPIVFLRRNRPGRGGARVDARAREGNVTGLSDKTDVLQHLAIFVRVAKIKTLGYIYTSSEANSASARADVEPACAKLGLKLVVQSINNSSEVKQATETIIGRVDGIYLTTDNTVYSALPAWSRSPWRTRNRSSPPTPRAQSRAAASSRAASTTTRPAARPAPSSPTSSPGRSPRKFRLSSSPTPRRPTSSSTSTSRSSAGSSSRRTSWRARARSSRTAN
jgi:ABC-type uncharacterized transport system substrate-binding protein